MPHFLLSVCAAVCFSASFSLAAVETTDIDNRDITFLVGATQHSLAMVRCAEIAVARGLIGDDLDFAVMIISDHTRMVQAMQELGEKMSLNLPVIPDLKHQELIDTLGSLSDQDLQTAFLKIVMDDQEQAVADFRNMAKKATDPRVVSFAAQNLDTLEAQRSYAKKLRVKD